AMLNHLELDVRESDLFAAVGGERFDLIAFNPPFFEREQGGALAVALSDRPGLPTTARFLAGARAHLEDGGSIYRAGSTNGALGRMRALYAENGYAHRVVAQRERISERLVIDALTC